MDPSIRARIVERFGEGVLESSPSVGTVGPPISRRALGAVVFADASALRDLEAILHPAMRDRFLREIDRPVREGRSPCVVLDAAVLLEAGWDDLCDRVVFVDAARAERLRRVKEGRGWSEPTLEARERSQWPCDRKRRRADWIVANDGDLDQLGREVDRVIERLHGPSAAPEVPPAVRSAPPIPGHPRARRAGAGLDRQTREDLVTRQPSRPTQSRRHPSQRSQDGRTHRRESPTT